MSTLIEISVHYVNKVVNSLWIIMSKSIWVHCLCIRDTIKSPLIWKLCKRVKWSKKSVLLCTVAWVCTWSKWCTSLTSVWHVTCKLTIYYIRCNCKDRCCWLRISVSMSLLNLVKEWLKKPYSDIISSVIIITILREVSLCLKCHSDTCLRISLWYSNLSILNSWKWIYYMWESSNTCCKCSLNICINKSHLSSFIVILIMHILDKVKCINIKIS